MEEDEKSNPNGLLFLGCVVCDYCTMRRFVIVPRGEVYCSRYTPWGALTRRMALRLSSQVNW